MKSKVHHSHVMVRKLLCVLTFLYFTSFFLFSAVTVINPYTNTSPIYLVFIHSTETKFHIGKRDTPNVSITSTNIGEDATYAYVDVGTIVLSTPGPSYPSTSIALTFTVERNGKDLTQGSHFIPFGLRLLDASTSKPVDGVFLDEGSEGVMSAIFHVTGAMVNTNIFIMQAKMNRTSYENAAAGSYSTNISIGLVSV